MIIVIDGAQDLDIKKNTDACTCMADLVIYKPMRIEALVAALRSLEKDYEEEI